jgi:hypothetical protein
LVSGAFFTGTLFAGILWELFGRNVMAGTFQDPAAENPLPLLFHLGEVSVLEMNG